ncbi:MAG: hypothetical protein AAF713_08885 [Pseudomonadota bacterium]
MSELFHDVVLGNSVFSAIAVDAMGGRVPASLVKTFRPKFAGVVLARQDSGIETALDLRGKRVATLF